MNRNLEWYGWILAAVATGVLVFRFWEFGVVVMTLFGCLSILSWNFRKGGVVRAGVGLLLFLVCAWHCSGQWVTATDISTDFVEYNPSAGVAFQVATYDALDAMANANGGGGALAFGSFGEQLPGTGAGGVAIVYWQGQYDQDWGEPGTVSAGDNDIADYQQGMSAVQFSIVGNSVVWGNQWQVDGQNGQWQMLQGAWVQPTAGDNINYGLGDEPNGSPISGTVGSPFGLGWEKAQLVVSGGSLSGVGASGLAGSLGFPLDTGPIGILGSLSTNNFSGGVADSGVLASSWVASFYKALPYVVVTVVLLAVLGWFVRHVHLRDRTRF